MILVVWEKLKMYTHINIMLQIYNCRDKTLNSAVHAKNTNCNWLKFQMLCITMSYFYVICTDKAPVIKKMLKIGLNVKL